MRKKDWCKGFHYIDAFSGPGIALDRETEEPVPGSPLRALDLEYKFSGYHFIDLDEDKLELLKEIVSNEYPELLGCCNFYQGDCNQILKFEICPQFSYGSFKRALVILDPYNIGVEWETLEKIGETGIGPKSDKGNMEIFYNFMISDANRNVLWESTSEGKNEEMRQNFDQCMPDNSWKDVMYESNPGLFGEELEQKIAGNREFVQWYRAKMKQLFKFVPEPSLMCNTIGAELYYLFFAAHQPVAKKIVGQVFNKYRRLELG